jgi:hypothetical protein
VHGVYHPTMIPRCTLHALVCGMSPSGNHSGDSWDGYITCPKNGYIYILVHTYAPNPAPQLDKDLKSCIVFCDGGR